MVDQVIDLSASMADEVGHRHTVPKLPPQDPSLASCSRSAESAIANLASNVVAVDVARIPETQDQIPRGPTFITLETTPPWYQHEKERSVITMRLG